MINANGRFVVSHKPASGGGGVTTHSALTNPGMTTGDDHTQYQLRC
jgi:hypothetical protein